MSLIFKIIIIAILIGGCDYLNDRSGVPDNTTAEMPGMIASLQPDGSNVHNLYQNPDSPAVSGNELEQAIRSIPEFSSFILYRDGEIISEMWDGACVRLATRAAWRRWRPT